jgi:hypothetical protein
MVYRFPSNEMLHYNDHYRIEGGYDEASQWIIQTKIAPVDCRIISDNVSSIYSNYFYDQVKQNSNRFFFKLNFVYLVSL